MTAEAKTLLDMNYQEARAAAAEFLAEWHIELGPKERNPAETLCKHHVMDLPVMALLIWKWAMANFTCLAEQGFVSHQIIGMALNACKQLLWSDQEG